MSETNNSDKSVGAPPPKATLHLKRPVEQGSVRQSFSHGRSKTVVVEKVKRRILTPGEAPPVGVPARTAAPAAPLTAAPAQVAARPVPTAPAKPAAPPPPKTGVVLPTLTAEQREARARALIDARANEEEDRRRQEAEAGVRREREARDRLEREAAEARKRDEEHRRAQEANFKRQSEDEARRRLSGGEPAPSPSIPRVAPTSARRRPPRSARAHGRRGGRDQARHTASRAGPAGTEGHRPDPAPATKRRAAQPRPPDRHQRNFRRGRAHALGRLVPSAHAAAEEPRRPGSERENRPRDRAAGGDHDPGARQPHVRACGRRDQASDAPGSHGDADGRARCRHGAARRRGDGPFGQAGRRVRRRGRPVRSAR